MHRGKHIHTHAHAGKRTNHAHVTGTYLGASAVTTGALSVKIKLILTDVGYTYSTFCRRKDRNRQIQREKVTGAECEKKPSRSSGAANQLHRLAAAYSARLPSCECAWAEWCWGEMTCVTSAGPLAADGLITYSPRAARVRTVLARSRTKNWLWLFSFSDFPCPSLGGGCTQSQLLNPGLWTIRHHLTPSMTDSSALLSHTRRSLARSGDRRAEDFIPYASVV